MSRTRRAYLDEVRFSEELGFHTQFEETDRRECTIPQG
jgi:hypothetical protein